MDVLFWCVVWAMVQMWNLFMRFSYGAVSFSLYSVSVGICHFTGLSSILSVEHGIVISSRIFYRQNENYCSWNFRSCEEVGKKHEMLSAPALDSSC